MIPEAEKMEKSETIEFPPGTPADTVEAVRAEIAEEACVRCGA